MKIFPYENPVIFVYIYLNEISVMIFGSTLRVWQMWLQLLECVHYELCFAHDSLRCA